MLEPILPSGQFCRRFAAMSPLGKDAGALNIGLLALHLNL